MSRRRREGRVGTAGGERVNGRRVGLGRVGRRLDRQERLEVEPRGRGLRVFPRQPLCIRDKEQERDRARTRSR